MANESAAAHPPWHVWTDSWSLLTSASTNQAHNEIAFPEGILQLPIRTADESLQRILKSVAETAREKQLAADPFHSQLRAAIVAALPTSDASLDRVAARLGLSTRTLQRRLRERRTSFSDELESIRKGAAEAYLLEPESSVSRVAFLLGFSDLTSFARAFQRWFGCSPREWRKRSTARPPAR